MEELERARRSALAMWDQDEASRRLGIELVEVGPGYARAAMTITAAMVNGHGIAHGGFVFALADSAFALACNTGGVVTVAATAEITFLAPSHLGDRLEAHAVERVRWGRSGLYDVAVHRAADDAHVAEFRGRSHATSTPLLPELGAPGGQG